MHNKSQKFYSTPFTGGAVSYRPKLAQIKRKVSLPPEQPNEGDAFLMYAPFLFYLPPPNQDHAHTLRFRNEVM